MKYLLGIISRIIFNDEGTYIVEVTENSAK
jgi:hypothetical protein